MQLTDFKISLKFSLYTFCVSVDLTKHYFYILSTTKKYESSLGENRTTCDYKDNNIDIRITGFVEIKAGDEDALLQVSKNTCFLLDIERNLNLN